MFRKVPRMIPMKIRYALFPLSLFCVFFTQSLSAQAEHDFLYWIGAEVEWKFKPKWELGVAAEFRLEENASRPRNFFLQPAVKYTPLHYLSIGLGYRFDERYAYKEQYFYERHRIFLDISPEYERKRWKISWRTRFQAQFSSYHEAGSDVPDMDLRNRFSVRYKWPKYSLYTSLATEIWSNLKPGEANGLDRFRLALENEYRINKKHRIQLMGLFQFGVNKSPRVYQWAFVTRYCFSI